MLSLALSCLLDFNTAFVFNVRTTGTIVFVLMFVVSIELLFLRVH